MRKNRKWIQEADLKKGALRNYMMRHYGPDAFTEKGTIKVKYLDDVIKNGTPHAKRMARLAKTLRQLKK
jgi:hypothetical protein